ncbi:MAG: SH3 domain-containing protein [Candidatus Nitronauta litoralis]|uniref:SH3 domain-containing protein n=1 Tax=Candidatus Nitronauta litoralis TaxID=2705533 RepID=A0A7T0BVZ5_9BACT|nr:MAG: SH3 domain-containing protein [Candidatus Nitronauta litoralis]
MIRNSPRLKIPVSIVGLLVAVMLILPVKAQAIPLDLVIDVKSKFSDGCLSIENLAELAQHRGIQGMVIADHDQVSLEYGFPPLERILKKKESGPSILESGATTYLAEIRQVNESFPKVLIIPGVETAPFYYWTGSPLDNNLVAHNWDKHLLVVGLNSPDQYEQLPALNSNASSRYASRFYWPFFAYVGGTIFFLVLFVIKRKPRLSMTAAVLMGVLAFNAHPFRSSPFDAYHGDAGVAPYKETIDYANELGGLIFWNHLESPAANGERKAGSMQLSTPLHPEDLLLTHNYTGFQALDDKPVPASAPGKEWDQTLTQYLDDQRAHPVWGYGANDYHCEDQEGHKLGEVRTVVQVDTKDTASVLKAMRLGQMYAVTQPNESSRLSLDAFVVADGTRGRQVGAGGTLISGDFPEISMAISSTGGKETAAKINIIRSGMLAKQETVSLPYQGKWRDLEVDLNEPVYYRLEIEAEEGGRLLSNPVFVKFQSGPFIENQVAEITEKKVAAGVKMPAEPGAPKLAEPEIPSPSKPAAPTVPEKVAKVRKPKVETPEAKAPEKPVMKSPKPVAEPQKTSTGKTVMTRLKMLSIRSGPGSKFPLVAKAERDEPLQLVRETTIMLSGKPWVIVKKDGKEGYVWSGFLKDAG